MKPNISKLFNVLLFAATATFILSSCEKDNYDEPEAGVIGKVVDQNGNPIQIGVGSASMTIHITEKSYAHGDPNIVVTPQDLNMHQDGTFSNNKLFAGTYDMQPWQGPFYEADDAAMKQEVVLTNGNHANVEFKVTPFFTLEWVKKPYYGEDGLVHASFRFFINKKDGYQIPNAQDCCIWISRTKFVGPMGEGIYTPKVTTITNQDAGNEIELKTEDSRPIQYPLTYYVRIGVRCKQEQLGGHTYYSKYLFTSILPLTITPEMMH